MGRRRTGLFSGGTRPLAGAFDHFPQSAVRFLRRPKLRRPVLVAAFEGWNDAGEAASFAASHLARAWGAVQFAEIDPEEFFDFTEVRPEVAIGEGDSRRVAWPATSLSIATVRDEGRDVVLLRGHEPQLRWRSYCETVVALARGLGVERALTLGAFLSEVTHSRPVPLSGTSSEPGLLEKFAIEPSRYEGPTGIVGVLSGALADAGVPTTSLWASVPCYSIPLSAKAALALVEVTTAMLGRSVDKVALEEQAFEYESRMDDLVREDENVAAYVARLQELEEATGGDLSAEGLAEEIERYLRGRRSG
ncbi:MAG TPA: PAC2 family protein [Acidimicrobiales bacterium]|nr:PAC2 family protein [Acidimicrobiales bacterium]